MNNAQQVAAYICFPGVSTIYHSTGSDVNSRLNTLLILDEAFPTSQTTSDSQRQERTCKLSLFLRSVPERKRQSVCYTMYPISMLFDNLVNIHYLINGGCCLLLFYFLLNLLIKFIFNAI